MDPDRFKSLEELRRSFLASFDEIITFTRQVRRLAELSEEDEPEILTFTFIVGCLQRNPSYCLPKFVHHREDLARELAHVITSVG